MIKRFEKDGFDVKEEVFVNPNVKLKQWSFVREIIKFKEDIKIHIDKRLANFSLEIARVHITIGDSNFTVLPNRYNPQECDKYSLGNGEFSIDKDKNEILLLLDKDFADKMNITSINLETNYGLTVKILRF